MIRKVTTKRMIIDFKKMREKVEEQEVEQSKGLRKYLESLRNTKNQKDFSFKDLNGDTVIEIQIERDKENTKADIDEQMKSLKKMLRELTGVKE